MVEQRTTAVASDHLVANINILKTSFVILELPANIKSFKHNLYMHPDNDLLHHIVFKDGAATSSVAVDPSRSIFINPALGLPDLFLFRILKHPTVLNCTFAWVHKDVFCSFRDLKDFKNILLSQSSCCRCARECSNASPYLLRSHFRTPDKKVNASNAVMDKICNEVVKVVHISSSDVDATIVAAYGRAVVVDVVELDVVNELTWSLLFCCVAIK